MGHLEAPRRVSSSQGQAATQEQKKTQTSESLVRSPSNNSFLTKSSSHTLSQRFVGVPTASALQHIYNCLKASARGQPPCSCRSSFATVFCPELNSLRGLINADLFRFYGIILFGLCKSPRAVRTLAPVIQHPGSALFAHDELSTPWRCLARSKWSESPCSYSLGDCWCLYASGAHFWREFTHSFRVFAHFFVLQWLLAIGLGCILNSPPCREVHGIRKTWRGFLKHTSESHWFRRVMCGPA